MQKIVTVFVYLGQILKKVCLFLFRKKPRINHFELDTNALINTNPAIISWKTKYTWKVELVGFGNVSASGLRILNNYKGKNTFTLVAYGFNSIIKKQIELYHLTAELPKPVGDEKVYDDIKRLNNPSQYYLQKNSIDKNFLKVEACKLKINNSLISLTSQFVAKSNASIAQLASNQFDVLGINTKHIELEINTLAFDLQSYVSGRYEEEFHNHILQT